MLLFGIGKEKVKVKPCRCQNEEIIKNQDIMDLVSKLKSEKISIKVLGSGCKNCNQLEQNVKQTLNLLNVDLEIEHVTDFVKISSYGAMAMPALVINEKLVSSGKILKQDEIIKILKSL